MKTRIAIATCFILFALVFCSRAATQVIKVSEFPNKTAPSGTDLFLLATPGVTNNNITYNQLRAAIGTNGSVTYITTNLYSSNAYITNLNVSYTTNLITYSSNAYITNLFSTTNFNNYTYTTNLFITQITTNSYLFSTNLFISYFYNTNNTYVSNYFQTNAFLNTYISNYFNTNLFNYVTNISQYTTNLTVTNFYLTDTFVSNFFNTNIFVNNSIVSNFFTTNLYNTINITSNYTFNVAWPLTNATLYGTTTFSPISGNQAGRIDILSAGVTNISFVGSNSAVQAGVFWFKTNSWSGPTNNLPMNVEDQYYTTTTDVNITNLNLLPTTGYSAGVLLSITNSTSGNKVLRFPLSIAIPERTNAVTLSNSAVGIFSIRYSPVGPSTQGVYRQF